MGNSAHERHEVKFLLSHRLSWVSMLLLLVTHLVSLPRVDIPAPAVWRGLGREAAKLGGAHQGELSRPSS